MTVPCASAGCSTTDVVTGIAQVSDQLHGLATFVVYESLVFVIIAVCAVAFLWANGRR